MSVIRLAVLVGLTLTACTASPVDSTGSTSTQPTPTSSTTSTTPSSRVVTPSTTVAETSTTTTAQTHFAVEISGGVVSGPDRIQVTQGDVVTFTVLSDIADHVHVHGYDLFFELVPSQTVEVSFEATAQGLFEVELESTHLLLLVIEVTS